MRGGGTRKRSAMRGGNLGNTFSFGGPPLGNNAAPVISQSSCMAEARPMVSPPSFGGLPGMRGGRRRTKSQRGGRYSFDLSTQLTPAAPWAGGIPQVQRIPCEAAVSNPLNAVQMGGVGGVDSAFYAAPTAGYTNNPSSWVGSTGAPSLLQTPYAASTTPPVCMKTGGGKRRRNGKKASRRNKRRGTRRGRRY